MKQSLFIILNMFAIVTFSQIQFDSGQNITLDIDWGQNCYTADIDGDSFIDVLSASSGDNTIAWYKNMDGLGTFGIKQVISSNAYFAKTVKAADIDGDSIVDVISASADDDKIAWYKNDGFGNFGVQQIISTDEDFLVDIFISDIDGDNDMDIVAAALHDNTISWYRNDGTGHFSNKLTIDTNFDYATSVFVADMDGDNDMDIVAAASHINTVAWYENTNGLGDFGARNIITDTANYVNDVYVADLDGDFAMDIIVASADTDKVAWFKNINNNTFTKHPISTIMTVPQDISVADYDNDGDIDLAVADYYREKIFIFNNTDGLGNFTRVQIIPVVGSPVGIHTADIDGDNDFDLLTATISSWTSNNRIAWYKNTSVTTATDNTSFKKYSISPNPTSNKIYLSLFEDDTIVEIKVFNSLGTLMLQVDNSNEVNIFSLTKGIYFLKFFTKNNVVYSERIIKN